MVKYCIFMPTTLEVSEDCVLFKRKHLEGNIERMKQYLNGLQSIVNFGYTNLILSDNSNYLRENRGKEMKKQMIDEKIQLIDDTPNEYGFQNKGAGVLEHYIHAKKLLSGYDYIIHFEPRQVLVNNNFIENFIENPGNLFTYNKKGKHFNTGLFCLKTIDFYSFVENNTPQSMVSKKSCLEDLLYSFIKSKEIKFRLLDKMGLTWYDTFAKKAITW